MALPRADSAGEGAEESKGGAVLRLCVQEAAAGIPLFDHVWGVWREKTATVSSLASLVSFFFQFARSLGNGEVRQVVFERSEVSPARPSWTPYGGGLASGSINNKIRGAGRRRAGVESQSVEMYALRDERFAVAVFVNGEFGRDRATALVTRYRDHFREAYTGKLVELEERLVESGKNPELANADLSYLPDFDGFRETALDMAKEA